MKLNSSLFYLIIAALIWGATVPIMKITLEEIPLFSLVVMRMTAASILLLPFIYKKIKNIKKEDYKLLFLSAFFGTNLNLAFFFYGLQNTEGINASVISATTPILTLFFAHFYLKEKLSIKLIAGATVALIGVLSIIGVPLFELHAKSAIGNISLLLSSLAWIGHEIFSKQALKRYDGLLVAFCTMATGALVFSPLSIIELFTHQNWFVKVSTDGLLGLAYGMVFASFIAYSAWQKGLAKTTATQASLIFYILPISGIIFSIVLLKESLSPMFLGGSSVVAIGILIAEYHRKSKLTALKQ